MNRGPVGPDSPDRDASGEAASMPMLTEGFSLHQPLRPEHLTSYLTLEDDLFAVWHLGTPDTPTETWQVTIGGAVMPQSEP